jgi:hypothetical protein
MAVKHSDEKTCTTAQVSDDEKTCIRDEKTCTAVQENLLKNHYRNREERESARADARGAPAQPDDQNYHEAERRSATGTLLPRGWQPSGDDFAFGLAQDLSHDQVHWEADKFRDHWHSISGAKAKRCDWAATWRNWVRRTAEANRPKEGKSLSAVIQRLGQRLGNGETLSLVSESARPQRQPATLDEVGAQLENFENVWREKLSTGKLINADDIERWLQYLDEVVQRVDEQADHPVIQHAHRLASELRSYFGRDEVAAPKLPLGPVNCSRCSRCRKPHDGRNGQRYCAKCHAAYNREHRKKQNEQHKRVHAENERLRAQVAELDKPRRRVG